MSDDWLTTDREGAVCITLHVQPGARKSELAGLYGNALKIRLNAPPVDGKANEALLQFLADWLSLPRSAFTLKSGHASRRKVVRAEGVLRTAIEEAIRRQACVVGTEPHAC